MLRIMGKCTSRHLVLYGQFPSLRKNDEKISEQGLPDTSTFQRWRLNSSKRKTATCNIFVNKEKYPTENTPCSKSPERAWSRGIVDSTKEYSFVLSTMPRLHARSRLLEQGVFSADEAKQDRKERFTCFKPSVFCKL